MANVNPTQIKSPLGGVAGEGNMLDSLTPAFYAKKRIRTHDLRHHHIQCREREIEMFPPVLNIGLI